MPRHSAPKGRVQTWVVPRSEGYWPSQQGIVKGPPKQSRDGREFIFPVQDRERSLSPTEVRALSQWRR